MGRAQELHVSVPCYNSLPGEDCEDAVSLNPVLSGSSARNAKPSTASVLRSDSSHFNVSGCSSDDPDSRYDFPYSPSEWDHPSGRLSPIRTKPATPTGWKAAFQQQQARVGPAAPSSHTVVLVPLPLGDSDTPRACLCPKPAARRHLLLAALLCASLLLVVVGIWCSSAAGDASSGVSNSPAHCWARAAVDTFGGLLGNAGGGSFDDVYHRCRGTGFESSQT